MVDLNSTKGENMEEKANDETLDQLQRLQAEFINYRKRVDQEKAGLVDYGKEQAILDFLEIYENFQRAKNNIDKEGIELIYKQFTELLTKYNVKSIDNKGKYNPELHEVIAKDGNDQEEDTITEVFQKGYTHNEKVIRPSKVKVSGGKQNE